MDKFTLNIELGNDAMQDADDVIGALYDVIKKMSDGHKA